MWNSIAIAMDSHGRVCWINLTRLYIYLVLLACYLEEVCSGQAVTVTVQAGEGFEGTGKVLTCRYAWIPPCPGTTCTLDGLAWKKGSDAIAYLSSAGNAVYYGDYNEPDYIISTMDFNAGCDLTIQSVAQTDSGSYTCEVNTRNPTSETDRGSAVLNVSVIVTATWYNDVQTVSTVGSIQSSTPPSRNSHSTGSILGIVVGCGLFLAVIIVASIIAYKRRKTTSQKESAEGLPDVTYAVVDKGKKQPLTSSQDPPDTYDNVVTMSTPMQQEDDSGRVVSEDGLIYTEVGHTQTHPAGKPAIQTEKATEYASVDVLRL